MANEKPQYVSAVPALVNKGNSEGEFIYINCPEESREGSEVSDEYEMIHPQAILSSDGETLINIVPAMGGGIVSFTETIKAESGSQKVSEEKKLINAINNGVKSDYININNGIIKNLENLKNENGVKIIPKTISNINEQKYFTEMLSIKKAIGKDVIYNGVVKYPYSDGDPLKSMLSLRYINVINGRKSGTDKKIEFFSDFAEYLNEEEEEIKTQRAKTSGIGSFKYISLNNLKDIIQYLLPMSYYIDTSDESNVKYISIIRTKEGVSLATLFLFLNYVLEIKPDSIVNNQIPGVSYVASILNSFGFDFEESEHTYIKTFLESNLDFKDTEDSDVSASDYFTLYGTNRSYIKDLFTFILPIIKLKQEMFQSTSISETIGFFTIAPAVDKNNREDTYSEDFFLYTPDMTFQNADGTYDNSVFNYGLQTGFLDGKIYVKDPKQYQTKFLSLKYSGPSKKKEFPIRYMPVPNTDLGAAYLSRTTKTKLNEDFLTTAAIDNNGNIVFELNAENFLGGATEPFGLEEEPDFKFYEINFMPVKFQRDEYQLYGSPNVNEPISILDNTIFHSQDGIEMSTFPNILSGLFGDSSYKKKISVKSSLSKENYIAGELNILTIYRLLNEKNKKLLREETYNYALNYVYPHYKEDFIEETFAFPDQSDRSSWVSSGDFEKILVTLFISNGFPLETKILKFFGFENLQSYFNYVCRTDYITTSEDFSQSKIEKLNNLNFNYPSIRTDLNFHKSNLYEPRSDVLLRSPNPYIMSTLQAIPAGDEGTSFILSVDGESFKRNINDTSTQIYNVYLRDPLGQLIKLKTQLKINKGGFEVKATIPDGTNKGGNKDPINLNDNLSIVLDADGNIDSKGEVKLSVYTSEESQVVIGEIFTEYNMDALGRMSIFSKDNTFRELFPFSDEVSGTVFLEVEYKGQKSRVKINLGDPVDSFQMNPIEPSDVKYSSPFNGDLTIEEIPIPNQEFFQSKITLLSSSKIFNPENSLYLYLAVPFDKNSLFFREDFLRAYSALSAFSFSERIFYLDDLITNVDDLGLSNDETPFRRKGYLLTKDFEIKFGDLDFNTPDFLKKIKVKESNNAFAQLLFPPEKYQKYNFDELKFLKEAAFIITTGDIDSLVGKVQKDYKVGILDYDQDDADNQIYRFVKHVEPEKTAQLFGKYSIVQIGNEKNIEGFGEPAKPFVSTPDVIGIYTINSDGEISKNVNNNIALNDFKLANFRFFKDDPKIKSISLSPSETVPGFLVAAKTSSASKYINYYMQNYDTKEEYVLPNPSKIYRSNILSETLYPYTEDIDDESTFPNVSSKFQHSLIEWKNFKQKNRGLFEVIVEEKHAKYGVICRSSKTKRITYTSHYFDLQGREIVYSGDGKFNYYDSNKIFGNSEAFSAFGFSNKKRSYFFYNKDFMLNPSTDIALRLRTSISSESDSAIIETGKSPNFAANQDLSLESFDYTIPSAQVFLEKLEGSKYIPSITDVNLSTFNPLDFSDNFDVFSNSKSIGEAESEEYKSKYQGRFIFESETSTLSLVPNKSKFTPLEFNVLNLDIEIETSEDAEESLNMIAFKYDLPFSEYFYEKTSDESLLSSKSFLSNFFKVSDFANSDKLYKAFLELERTGSNLVRVGMASLEFIKENGETVSLENASNIVLENNDIIDLYFSGDVDKNQKIFFSGVEVSGSWDVRIESANTYSVFTFVVTEKLISAGLAFQTNSEFSGSVFSKPNCFPVSAGRVDFEVDNREDYTDSGKDKNSERKEKDNDAFNPFDFDLKDVNLKFGAIEIAKDSVGEITHLMKSFCDFSFSMTKELKMQLNGFKNILVIVKVIFCIIDVICNLFNPVKAAKAIFRLFICLFDLLSLLPQFSIPIAFIHLGVHLLKLIQCVVKKVNDFLKMLQDFAIAFETAIEAKDLNSLLEIERVINKYIGNIKLDLNVMKPITDILEIFKELLEFVFIFPCSTTDGGEVFNVCGASDESVAALMVGKMIENNRINTKALFPIAQSYTTLSKNSLTLDSSGSVTSYCGNTPPSKFDDTTTEDKQGECFGSDLDIFKEAWNEYSKAGDSIVATITDDFDTFNSEYVNPASLRFQSDVFEATYSASFTKTVGKFAFLTVDPRDCEFHFGYKGITSEFSFNFFLQILFRKKIIDENQNSDSPIIPLNLDENNLIIDKNFVTNEEVYFVNPSPNPTSSNKNRVKLEGNFIDGFTVPKLPIEYIVNIDETAEIRNHKVPAIVMIDEDFHVYVIKKIYIDNSAAKEKIGITKIDAMRVGHPSFQKKTFSLEEETAIMDPVIYYTQQNYDRIKNFFKFETDAFLTSTPSVKMEDEFDPDKIDPSTSEGTSNAGSQRLAISSTDSLDSKWSKTSNIQSKLIDPDIIFNDVITASYDIQPDFISNTSVHGMARAAFKALFNGDEEEAQRLSNYPSFDYTGYNHATTGSPYPSFDPTSKFLDAYRGSVGDVKVYDFKQVYFFDTAFIIDELLSICENNTPLFELNEDNTDIGNIVSEAQDCVNLFSSTMDGLLDDIRNRISQGQGFADLLTLNNFILPGIDLKECIEDLLDQMCKFAFSPFNSSFLIVKDEKVEDRPGFSKVDINEVDEFILDGSFSSSDLNSYKVTGANEYAAGIGDNGEFFTKEKAEVQIIPRYISDEEYSPEYDLRSKIYITIVSDTGGQAYVEEYKENDVVYQTTKSGNTYTAFIRSPVETEVQIRCTVCNKAISAFAPSALVEQEILSDGTTISICNTNNFSNEEIQEEIPFGQLREVDRILDIKFTEKQEGELLDSDVQSFGVRSDSEVFGGQE